MRRRWGARVFGMLVCAYIWVLLGVGAFREIPAAPITRPGAFHLLIDPDVRGVIWVVTAALAVCTAWSRRWSWVGIMGLFFMPGLSMFSFAVSWVLAKIPGGSPGYPDAWYSAALYLAVVLLPILAALIPSPPAALTEDER